MTMPRVVVVEDDASLRKFVGLALEGLEVELVVCDSVKNAVSALRGRPAQLVITDLMMPGEPGTSLLKRLRDDPSLRQNARLAVFSAGLDASWRNELREFDVWRFLLKPVSVAQLVNCVKEGVGECNSLRACASPEWMADPVETHFAGDTELFKLFLASALSQLPIDVQQGDVASDQCDLVALQHVAHSLKSVLLLLGADESSEMARATEDEAARGSNVAFNRWQTLRKSVTDFVSRHSPH